MPEALTLANALEHLFERACAAVGEGDESGGDDLRVQAIASTAASMQRVGFEAP